MVSPSLVMHQVEMSAIAMPRSGVAPAHANYLIAKTRSASPMWRDTTCSPRPVPAGEHLLVAWQRSRRILPRSHRRGSPPIRHQSIDAHRELPVEDMYSVVRGDVTLGGRQRVIGVDRGHVAPAPQVLGPRLRGRRPGPRPP